MLPDVDGRDPAVGIIEQLAPRAWPPEFRQDLDGWSLRRSPGEPTRRANSVLPNLHRGTMPVEAKVDAVEAFYAGGDHPSRFQVTPLASPVGLDNILERRGYLVDAPTLVMTAALPDPATHPPRAGFATILRDDLDDDWLATLHGVQPGSLAGATPTRILERIAPSTVYVRALLDDQSAAVGLGVIDAGWVGIYCIQTASEMRRRGAATAVLSALLRTASDRGARAAYLSVLEENLAARRLYEQIGFRSLYRYHYRRLPAERSR